MQSFAAFAVSLRINQLTVNFFVNSLIQSTLGGNLCVGYVMHCMKFKIKIVLWRINQNDFLIFNEVN